MQRLPGGRVFRLSVPCDYLAEIRGKGQDFGSVSYTHLLSVEAELPHPARPETTRAAAATAAINRFFFILSPSKLIICYFYARHPSPLDGADHNTFYKILLQERIHTDDRQRGYNNHHIFDNLGHLLPFHQSLDFSRIRYLGQLCLLYTSCIQNSCPLIHFFFLLFICKPSYPKSPDPYQPYPGFPVLPDF